MCRVPIARWLRPDVIAFLLKGCQPGSVGMPLAPDAKAGVKNGLATIRILDSRLVSV